MVTIDAILQRNLKIAVIGLGYVGLPLAAAFGHKAAVIGFDIDERKMSQLRDGYDATGELSSEQLAATTIDYTTDPARLKEVQFHIVTVPTPIDGNNKPDLRPIESASRAPMIAAHSYRYDVRLVYQLPCAYEPRYVLLPLHPRRRPSGQHSPGASEKTADGQR